METQKMPILQKPQMCISSLSAGASALPVCGSSFEEDPAPLENLVLEKQNLSDTRGSGMEFRRVLFRHCLFCGVQWQKAAFTDVIFEHCDFSGARLPGVYLQRAEFRDCKMLGADWPSACLQNVLLDSCQMRMLNLNACSMQSVLWRDCAAEELSLQNARRLQNLALLRCSLIRAEFLHTSLSGLDLRSCRTDGILVSESFRELRGAVVTPLQAVELSRLLGVLIRE